MTWSICSSPSPIIRQRRGRFSTARPIRLPTWREFLGRYAQLAGHERWLPIPPQLLYPFGWLALLIAPRYSMLGDALDQLSFLQREVTYKMDKARDLLGWQPQIDLDEGIARCVPWLREQGLLS